MGQCGGVTVETNIYKREQHYATDRSVSPPPIMADFYGDQPWPMRESNWALDARSAATTVAHFYETTGGRPVDGVVFTDTRLLERLLRVTGPITLPGSDQNFSSETVSDLLQTEVEKNYFADLENQLANEPKTIIAEFLPTLGKHLATSNPNTLLAALKAAVVEKALLVVMKDRDLARTFGKLNWDGQLLGKDGDFVYVNESNFAPIAASDTQQGAKSAWSIERTVDLEIAADGQHTLRLHRRHIGTGIWPDGSSNAFLRIVLPLGTKIQDVRRADRSIITDSVTAIDAGKTVVGFWSSLEPGQIDDLLIEYRPPQDLKPGLVIQRQPGMPAHPWIVTRDGVDWYSGQLARDIELREE